MAVGQARKGGVFFVVLMTMFAIGLAFGGSFLPFTTDEPLVFLGAAAQWVVFVPRLLAGFAGLGQGAVTAVTYDYGNTFLIVAGLLNTVDHARRVRPRDRTKATVMTTHLGVMILFAACVSTVFGTLLRDQVRDQVRLGAQIFSSLVVSAYAIGWLMYFVFG